MTDAEPSEADLPSGESVVVTRSVRLLVPFVLTFGLYTMFHGTASVGGGFQGGVVVGATIVTLAFAFGPDQVGEWLRERDVLAVATTGVVAFALVGVLTVLLGGRFLDFGVLPLTKAFVYGVEFVEVGIGVTVAATVVVLLLAVTGHYGGPERSAEDRANTRDAEGDRR